MGVNYLLGAVPVMLVSRQRGGKRMVFDAGRGQIQSESMTLMSDQLFGAPA
jgi:hypothetical protein